MSSNDSPFVPNYEIFPEIENDPRQFLIKLASVYQSIAFRMNKKDIAIYEAGIEVPNGQQFFGANPQTKRDGFRKVLQTGTLSTGANTVAHNITFPTPNTYHFTRIYGVIEDLTVPEWVPIPNNAVTVTVDATNVNINIPGAYNGYGGIVVLEYVKTD